MLRTINAEPTLWDAILPECCLGLPPGLADVDELLDDARFFVPFVGVFAPRQGRPSIPMETYLRMMFLRFRYKLGFETLCREVSDSIAWRRFCRIPLDAPVPHPTTLLKITARCGPAVVEALNEGLLAKAAEAKLVRLDAVRVDTTVVEANVAYPTDSGLLAKGVARMAVLAARLKAAGLAKRTRFRDRTRSVRRRAHRVAAWLRRRNDDARAEVLAITGELAAIADATVGEARAVAANARRGLARRGLPAASRLAAMITALEVTAAAVEQIAAQTRARLAGQIPDGSTRVVSLHDLDARPIAKGRLGRPVGIRLQSTGGRQRRWCGHRPCSSQRQPARRPDARPCRRTNQSPLRSSPPCGHRGPGLRRSPHRRRTRGSGRDQDSDPTARKARLGPDQTAANSKFRPSRQMADRVRSPHLLPKAGLRMEAQPLRHPRRHPNLVRVGSSRPQLDQDRRPQLPRRHHSDGPATHIATTTTPEHPRHRPTHPDASIPNRCMTPRPTPPPDTPPTVPNGPNGRREKPRRPGDNPTQPHTHHSSHTRPPTTATISGASS